MEASTSPAKQVVRRLSRAIADVSRKSSPERVHKLRTSIRRVEVLVASAAMAEKRQQKARKLLKKLRRRAGKIRDIDVQSAALESVNIGREEKLKRELLGEFERVRSKREKKLISTLKPKFRSRLRKNLAEMEYKPETGRHGEASRALSQLNLLRQEWQQNRPSGIAELHAFRMKCKRVRYSFELAAGFELSEKYIAALKAIQDAIGEAHDWAVLTETVAARAAAISPLLAAVRAMASSKQADARRITALKMDELANISISKRVPQSTEAARPKPAKASHAVA